MSTVTFFHAHPDDEAIATGGTMAALADAGHRVVLVTATRGELGEIPEGLLHAGETLAERRAAELATAAAALGVARQEFLPYLDSGMAGEPTNDRPGCFAAADVDEAAAHLARILEEEDSDALVIYDEHGGYGHPDHVQVHVVGTRAAELAGTGVLYLATMDRDALAALREQSADGGLGEDTPELPDGAEEMGEPAARITTEVDVRAWLGAKRTAMAAHASQIAEDSFFLSLPDEVFAQVWGQEWYVRVRPPFDRSVDGSREPELLLAAGSAAR